MEANNNDNMLIYQSEDGKIKIDVRFEGETAWLSLEQMSMLFGRDKSTISRHIKNVFEEGELNLNSTVAKFATVASKDNSPSSKTFLICREIVDLSRPKRVAIWSNVSHTVSFSNLTSIFIFPSAD